MRFENPWALALLLLLPIFYRWWLKRNQPARIQYSVPIPAQVSQTNPIRMILLGQLFGLGLLILALARPQSSYQQIERTVSGIDIMMVMDFSASMNIEDLGERSRFEIAKDMMERFIKGRSNDRIGFVIFSGEPLTLAPPTLDYGLVLKALKDAALGVLKDGTAIGDGLTLAVNRLKNSTAKSKVVILLTDGDNNVGQVDPATAGDVAQGFGIKVYTIAIGREGRVRMPIRQKGIMGNTVTSYQWFENALNPQLLQQIAAQTSGKFYRVTDETALESVFKEIDQLEKSQVKATEKTQYEDIYHRPLKLGFLVLLICQILAQGWWRILG
jgi:Ca-activated chloride channel family protein